MTKFLTIVLATLFFQSSANAIMSLECFSTFRISKNKQYIYIRWIDDTKNEKFDREIYADKIIIKKDEYPRTGLYEVKNKKFLWRIEDVDLSHIGDRCLKYGQPSNDGSFVVAFPYAELSMDDEAISIYENGNLLLNKRVNQFCTKEQAYDREGAFDVSPINWISHYYFDANKNVVSFMACFKDIVYDLEKLSYEKFGITVDLIIRYIRKKFI
ncbi:MAG: hypothetical protein COW01_07395 [Bdellovibrionales bacterium CG12_big_fil_rev_8_21_14_0_65_38_15]|nr:MAG: hypothetical protein COW79_06560 [Bdellovibrionales bacterium CG22_combo_CG10-13_8_21_14_all_38_13]PIQ55455.1 MAG: hypothetical protein COW01_07395 [Bdellovibrionales bacterium CG12_big_fil_rev_8_21_14_0_65_38_15]PIR29196.1 MAG: hypothetical protein COV38_12130 [Bdellovibrionales bacterium CG11_big_fil_rev_8_21_14_0_20_38_13]